MTQLGDDRLVENRLEQAAIFLGEELFFHIPLAFQPPDEVQQIQPLAVQVQLDANTAAQAALLAFKQRLDAHSVGV